MWKMEWGRHALAQSPQREHASGLISGKYWFTSAFESGWRGPESRSIPNRMETFGQSISQTRRRTLYPSLWRVILKFTAKRVLPVPPLPPVLEMKSAIYLILNLFIGSQI